jgi:acyl carrier protein
MPEVSHSEVRDATTAYILDELAPTTDADELTGSTNLIEEEILDSLGIFAVVAFIEEKFGIEVDPEDVTIDNFETVDAICDLVARRLTPGTAP